MLKYKTEKAPPQSIERLQNVQCSIINADTTLSDWLSENAISAYAHVCSNRFHKLVRYSSIGTGGLIAFSKQNWIFLSGSYSLPKL